MYSNPPALGWNWMHNYMKISIDEFTWPTLANMLKLNTVFHILLLIGTLLMPTACSENNEPPTPYQEGILNAEPAWTLRLPSNLVSTPVTDGTLVFIRTTNQI